MDIVEIDLLHPWFLPIKRNFLFSFFLFLVFLYGSSRVPPFGGSIVDKQHDRYNKENKEEEGKGGVER